MEATRQKYETPVITKVKFEEKELVSFNVCKKASIELDLTSCCQVYVPTPASNLNTLDPS